MVIKVPGNFMVNLFCSSYMFKALKLATCASVDLKMANCFNTALPSHKKIRVFKPKANTLCF